jgi:transposase
MADHKEVPGAKAGASPRGKYRRHSEEEKQRIVAETYELGASVAVVARRNEVNANQVFNWRRQYSKGPSALIPVGIIAPTAPAPVEQKQATSQRAPAPPEARKLIAIELACGAKIRIDGDVRLPVLQSVLKLARVLA